MSQNITFQNFEETLVELLGGIFKGVTFTPWKDQVNGKGWDATITADGQGFQASYIFDTLPIHSFYCDVDEYLAQNHPNSDDIQYFVPKLVLI